MKTGKNLIMVAALAFLPCVAGAEALVTERSNFA